LYAGAWALVAVLDLAVAAAQAGQPAPDWARWPALARWGPPAGMLGLAALAAAAAALGLLVGPQEAAPGTWWARAWGLGSLGLVLAVPTLVAGSTALSFVPGAIGTRGAALHPEVLVTAALGLLLLGAGGALAWSRRELRVDPASRTVELRWGRGPVVVETWPFTAFTAVKVEQFAGSAQGRWRVFLVRGVGDPVQAATSALPETAREMAKELANLGGWTPVTP
jgi:hypothetical protein